MKYYGQEWFKSSVVADLKSHALGGVFDGRETFYVGYCTGFHAPTGSFLIFTRDTGHHTSGWFKNPDYERCLHLSMSFRAPFDVSIPRDFDVALAKEWAEIFFGEARRYIWAESPKSDVGKAAGVWHYRVFCDEHWQPMLPRGEVYSTEFTEKGWKSWSEVQGEQPLPGSGALGTAL
jgi:hypothetical protein